MKGWIPVLMTVFLCTSLRAQKTYTIKTDGFTFSPSELNVNMGDTIIFDVGTTHTATQVSKATWDANGTLALEGGFNFSSGEYTYVPTQAGTIYYVCENHVSLGMKGEIIVNGPTGSDRLASPGPDLYPNPAGDLIHLRLPDLSPSEIGLYDMTGKEIRDLDNLNRGKQPMTITVSGLHKGIYFVRIKYPAKIYVLKFVKL